MTQRTYTGTIPEREMDRSMDIREIAADLEGYTEHELRETLAEAIKVLGKTRVDEIINEELPL